MPVIWHKDKDGGVKLKIDGEEIREISLYDDIMPSYPVFQTVSYAAGNKTPAFPATPHGYPFP